MSTNEKEILRGIMRDLKDGFTFGKDYTWDYTIVNVVEGFSA